MTDPCHKELKISNSAKGQQLRKVEAREDDAVHFRNHIVPVLQLLGATVLIPVVGFEKEVVISETQLNSRPES